MVGCASTGQLYHHLIMDKYYSLKYPSWYHSLYSDGVDESWAFRLCFVPRACPSTSDSCYFVFEPPLRVQYWRHSDSVVVKGVHDEELTQLQFNSAHCYVGRCIMSRGRIIWNLEEIKSRSPIIIKLLVKAAISIRLKALRFLGRLIHLI